MKNTVCDLIYDWNNKNTSSLELEKIKSVEVHDETLRDGIQSNGIIQPCLEKKLELIHVMDKMGINSVCIGYPATSMVNNHDCGIIIQDCKDSKIKMSLSCAARTVVKDVYPIVELSQKHGVELYANIFIGSSPIRKYVEGWELDYILQCTRESVSFAVKNNLNVCFITEDTTRSHPDDLRKIYETAIECGAKRLCLCDTVGYSTSNGTRQLVKFVKDLIAKSGKEVYIDWHGHNDRGLGLANALAAVEAGVDRIHATGLGIGERSGNTSMEQLLINLYLQNKTQIDVKYINEYCKIVKDAYTVEIPFNLPVVGSDVFSTSTGVHASAIRKANHMNNVWLADRVYSSIPAHDIGREQTITIGPMSGKSNVYHVLEQRNHSLNDGVVESLLSFSKLKGTNLSDVEIENIINAYYEKTDAQDEEFVINDNVLKVFQDQKYNLLEYVKKANTDEIRIATLGPKGTSSYYAYSYFVKYMRSLETGKKFSVVLKDNFDLVIECLERKEVDLIIIPNAYDRITEMYWNPRLYNLFSFLLKTPDYGIASIDGSYNHKDKKVKIACCKPVYCLIDELIQEINPTIQEYEIVQKYSTIESAKALKNGEAELALTNSTSVNETGIKFITSVWHADVLWSIFSNRLD